MLFATHYRYQHQAVAQFHRRAHRLFQTLFDTGLDQQAVDHNFDGVVLALVELDALQLFVQVS